MIVPKKLLAPTLKTRSVRRELSLFRDKNGALTCYGLHFKEKEGSLVVAEGAKAISDLPQGTLRLISPVGHRGGRYAFAVNGRLISLDGGDSFTGVPSPEELICYRTQEGEELYYVMTKTAFFRLGTNVAAEMRGLPGGNCACVCFERLFVASGETVRWTEPFAPENWNESLNEGGTLELPAPDGEIHSMIAYREKIILFRERGIVSLRAQADPLEFRAEKIPCTCSEIRKGSVRLCGDQILFFADGGLFSFNGTTVKRVSGCGSAEVDFEREIETAVCGDRYFASVSLKSGEKSLWVVDPSTETGHFLRVQAEMLAGGESLLFGEEGKLYRLTESGVPKRGRRECVLLTEPSLLGLSPRQKYLFGVTLEGRGRFRVEARAERGPARAVLGAAGERLVFPAPVKGTSFALCIRTMDESAKIRHITFDIKEDSEVW